MKKAFTVLSMLAVFAMANAQMTYRVVYVPGPGEHQFGFSLAPSYASQHLGVNFNAIDPSTNNPVSIDADGLVTNALGVNVGLFYGYETVGNSLDWGNYTSLYYGMNPFSGKVTLTRGGVAEEHEISYLSHRVHLHFNPFLSYRINDQFSVSGGLGLSIAPEISSNLTCDGQKFTSNQDSEASLFSKLFYIYLDANAGVKYWFTDEWYVGLRVQYNFLSLMDFLSDDDSDAETILDEMNGALSINLDDATYRSTILPKKPFQAVFSIGYAW